MEKQGREIIPITPSLRLVPYYPAYETTLPWYQDADVCKQSRSTTATVCTT